MDDPNIDIPPYATPRLRARRIDSTTKRIVLVASGIGFGLIGLAIIWSGVHTDLGPPPIITAPPGPMRTKPADPGGLQVPGANEQIMSGTPSASAPQLAPAPPQPDLAALAPPQPPAATPTAAASATPPDQPASSNPGNASVIPPSAPAPEPAAMPSEAHLASPPQPQAAIASPASPMASGQPHENMVQLAALPTQEGALRAWHTLTKKAPKLLSGRTPAIVPAVVHGRNFFQVRLGFATRADATEFCSRLRSSGIACYQPKS